MLIYISSLWEEEEEVPVLLLVLLLPQPSRASCPGGNLPEGSPLPPFLITPNWYGCVSAAEPGLGPALRARKLCLFMKGMRASGDLVPGFLSCYVYLLDTPECF